MNCRLTLRPLPTRTPIRQGIGIIQYLFVLAYCLVGIFVALSVAQALMSGSAGYALLYLILAPVWLLILTMVLRCVPKACWHPTPRFNPPIHPTPPPTNRLGAELAISVLMAPHQLAQNQKDILRLLQEQNARLLAAAGATGSNDQATHCPESELEAGRPGSGAFRGIGSSGSGGVGGRRGNITAGDVDEEEEVGIRMASV